MSNDTNFKNIENKDKFINSNVRNVNEFDIYNDFKMREMINSDNENNLPNENNEELILENLILVNDNLRSNIELSLAIFKKLNNFEHNYIHNFINESN